MITILDALFAGVESFGVSKPEFTKVLINPNDVIVSGYDASLITVVKDDKLNNENAKKGYGCFSLRVFPSGKRGGMQIHYYELQGSDFQDKSSCT